MGKSNVHADLLLSICYETNQLSDVEIDVIDTSTRDPDISNFDNIKEVSYDEGLRTLVMGVPTKSQSAMPLRLSCFTC
jgi:hypothetical protein